MENYASWMNTVCLVVVSSMFAKDQRHMSEGKEVLVALMINVKEISSA